VTQTGAAVVTRERQSTIPGAASPPSRKAGCHARADATSRSSSSSPGAGRRDARPRSVAVGHGERGGGRSISAQLLPRAPSATSIALLLHAQVDGASAPRERYGPLRTRGFSTAATPTGRSGPRARSVRRWARIAAGVVPPGCLTAARCRRAGASRVPPASQIDARRPRPRSRFVPLAPVPPSSGSPRGTSRPRASRVLAGEGRWPRIRGDAARAPGEELVVRVELRGRAPALQPAAPGAIPEERAAAAEELGARPSARSAPQAALRGTSTPHARSRPATCGANRTCSGAALEFSGRAPLPTRALLFDELAPAGARGRGSRANPAARRAYLSEGFSPTSTRRSPRSLLTEGSAVKIDRIPRRVRVRPSR
jgi:hypothetical protein